MIWGGIVWEAMADVNYEVVIITELGRSALAPETDAPRGQGVVSERPRGSETENSFDGGLLQ